MKKTEVKVSLTITSEVRYNKPVQRTDLPPYHVEEMGEVVDMRELAAEVLADYREPVDLTVEALAELCVKGQNGRRIKVAEYPPNVDRNIVDDLRRRCSHWLWWRHRQRQLREGGCFPHRQFRCGEDACPEAVAANGKIVPTMEMRRLPFNGCWGPRCDCDYRLVKRDGTTY